ncbi:MAG: hypothetical protein ACXVCE_10020 [Bacteriovorax sp.]
MKLMKFTSALTISSLLLLSCSKGSSSQPVANSENVVKAEVEDSNQMYLLWRQLTNENQSNLALSEFLVKSIYRENKIYIQKNIRPLTLDEIQSLVTQLQRNSKSTQNDLVFYGSSFKNDQDFLNKTLLATDAGRSSASSFEQQFIVTAATKIKKDLLSNILSVYDQRIAENSNQLADFILKDINDNNPDLKAKLEQTAADNPSALKDLIAKSLPTLKKVDTLFKNSELNNDEQLTSAAIGVMGFQVYNKIKDKKTFKEILKTYTEVSDVIKRAKEVKALLAGLNDYQKDIKQNWDELGKAMKGLAQDSSELKQIADYDPKVSGKKVQNFLYAAVFKGNATTEDGTNPSVLSKQISLNQNLTTVIDRAEKINNSFGLILSSAQEIAKKLHIDLPEGVQKAIATSKKASMLFTAVNKTIQGLKTGGIMGALSALSSGPAMDLMGLNGDPDAAFKGEVLAQLGVINQKLDDILELQKQTIKIQIETMSMIKNMAIMIDNYHREEMDILSEIRDTTLTILETNKIALNSNLRACEILLNYQLNSNSSLEVYKTDAYEDMRALDLDIQKLKNNLKSYNDIAQMIGSTGEAGWENCQTGLNQAFGLINVTENPIRAIFSSTENQNLFKFQRERYAPLYQFLTVTKKPSSLYHLPVANFSSLTQKYLYLKNDDSSKMNYTMEDFISTRALERNTAQLLVFYPFLDLTAGEWKSGLKNVLDLSINNSNSGKSSRAYYLLRNDLALIQTAIAEESLLSGELIFDQLKLNTNVIFHDDINSKSELAYAVLTNRLLMKNFMKYLISTRIDEEFNSLSLQDYETALENKDLKVLSNYFDNETIQKNLALDKDDNIVLKLKIDGEEQDYRLPSLVELQDNKISYSENMYRLLELQKRVRDSLAKVAPNNFSRDQKDQIARMMIYQ